jgi:hypothetical protein
MDDEAAITQLMARYTHAADDLRNEDFANCFAPDGSLTLVKTAVHPREKILEFSKKGTPPERPAGRRAFMHLTLSSAIDVTGETSATGLSDVMVLMIGDGIQIISVGRFHDVFVKLDGQWFFKERVAKMEYPETGGEPLDAIAQAVMNGDD